MFGVFENDEPCSIDPEWIKTTFWKTHLFTTFEAAEQYARAWLGVIDPGEGYLKLNVPWDYNGYGDMIVIKEV